MERVTALQLFLLLIVPVLSAIIIHEIAHGWVALKYGDHTAQIMGRLTLNPIKHIDLIGTILVPAVMYFASGFIFGWAKPVPVNANNLRNPKRDMAIVAFAGPGINFVMAVFWGMVAKLGTIIVASHAWAGLAVIYMGIGGLLINTVLLVLNLIPVPPLDGSRIVSSFLPESLDFHYRKLEPFGFAILLVLIFTGMLSKVMTLPIITITNFVLYLVQVPNVFLLSFLKIH